MHAGGGCGHGERRALALLRPRGLVHDLGQPAQVQQPGLGLLLRAHQRHRQGRGAACQEAAAGPAARAASGHARVHARLQRLPAGRGRREGAERSALQGPAVGAPDHRARPVPPLLPAGRAGVGADRAGRHRKGGAGRRQRLGRAHGGPPRIDGARARPAQDRPWRGFQRLGPRRRRHRQRQGHGAGQPTLPVGGLRALLPVTRHGPRPAGRVGRDALRRARGAHRPHQGAGLVAHRGHRVAADAVRAQARARRPVQLLPGRQAHEDEGHQAHGQGEGGRCARGPLAHALRDRPWPHVHLAAGPAAVSLVRHHRLRHGRRERRQLPLPQPLPGDQQGPERAPVRRHPAPLPGASRG